MTNREQLKRKVIEAIHGLPYEECTRPCWMCAANKRALDNPLPDCPACTGSGKTIYDYKITIGRVFAALSSLKLENLVNGHINNRGEFVLRNESGMIDWKLTKYNYQDCIDDDQDDETIDVILQLLDKV